MNAYFIFVMKNRDLSHWDLTIPYIVSEILSQLIKSSHNCCCEEQKSLSSHPLLQQLYHFIQKSNYINQDEEVKEENQISNNQILHIPISSF